MRAVWMVVMMVGLSGAAWGQDAKSSADALDMTKAERAVGDDTPTKASVDLLIANLATAKKIGDCEKIIMASEEVALSANHLSNLLRRGNEPFYSASYDEKKYFVIDPELGKREEQPNYYFEARNEAWVSKAECLEKTGRKSAAASLYYHALGHMDLFEKATWKRARDGIWRIAGVK